MVTLAFVRVAQLVKATDCNSVIVGSNPTTYLKIYNNKENKNDKRR